MQLTERCDVWRFLGAYDQGKQLEIAYSSVPCLRVPISKMDKLANSLASSGTDSTPREFWRSEARISTDTFLLPNYVQVVPDDEIRRGRRVDINGNPQQFIYTVNGIQDFDQLGYEGLFLVFTERSQ